MLGAFINQWNDRRPRFTNRDALLLNARQFNQEVARERLRSTRRSIPFCVVAIQLSGDKSSVRQSRALLRLLHRNLRMTDYKASLGHGLFSVLLVDTPEMGGRTVLDRLEGLAEKHGIHATMNLRVHDPKGFAIGDDDPDSNDGRNRRGDIASSDEAQAGRGDVSARWLLVEGRDVAVTAEDPMVPRATVTMGAKRAIDVIGASVGLILFSPLILGGMLATRVSSPGPVIFSQTREGYRGKPFTIYKLRSMVVGAESIQSELMADNERDGPAFKHKNDPRVTAVGRLIRATCIDELPQLWNILKGDMSLVGPRPLPWHESRACASWQRRRLDVRPGLTCYWQVNKSKAETFDDWMRLDLRYIDEIGMLRDLRLIVQTVAVPVTGRGSQ